MDEKKTGKKRFFSFASKVRGRISERGLGEKVKREGQKSKNFLLAFVVSYLVISLLFKLVPIELFELAVAQATTIYLNFRGIDTLLVIQEPVLIITGNGVKILISELCTGLLELTVLWSSIIASLGIPARDRLFGVVAGLFATQFFNLARIFITIEFILGADMATVDFVHNILFRATLIAVIVGIYTIWFMGATRKQA